MSQKMRGDIVLSMSSWPDCCKVAATDPGICKPPIAGRECDSSCKVEDIARTVAMRRTGSTSCGSHGLELADLLLDDGDAASKHGAYRYGADPNTSRGRSSTVTESLRTRASSAARGGCLVSRAIDVPLTQTEDARRPSFALTSGRGAL
jgi:hypothetical protein